MPRAVPDAWQAFDNIFRLNNFNEEESHNGEKKTPVEIKLNSKKIHRLLDGALVT